MCNGLPRTSLSYSGDVLRSFNVQPTSKLCRNVRKRLFSLRIWSPRYKHVNCDVKQSFDHSVNCDVKQSFDHSVNCDVKQSFDHSVTVRKSLLGVKLGVMNCQSIGGKLDFVFDHVKEYKLDIVALTETWLSNEDSKNKHVIDQCVAHGYIIIGRFYYDKSTKTLYKYSHDRLEIKDIRCIHQGIERERK